MLEYRTPLKITNTPHGTNFRVYFVQNKGRQGAHNESGVLGNISSGIDTLLRVYTVLVIEKSSCYTNISINIDIKVMLA